MKHRLRSGFEGMLPLALALCLGVVALAAAGEAAAQSRRNADASVVRALWDHKWTLQSARDAAGQRLEALPPPGRPITMNFNEGNVSIQGACNQMNGRWSLSPQGPLNFGQLAATMRSCEPPLMAADRALADALAQPVAVLLTPGASPTLRLTTASRHELVFGGQPTPRSLYGKPKRLFLEVAAQTVECKPPSATGARCIEVREVRFDQKGLRTGQPGPWRPLAEPIEGYTHAPGVRSVLRVDRYQRKPAKAGESAAVYVLDLVVESEIVAGK